MRQGNFLEGILAGINSYKQTRQWVEGMESNELQQQRMKMMNDITAEEQGWQREDRAWKPPQVEGYDILPTGPHSNQYYRKPEAEIPWDEQLRRRGQELEQGYEIGKKYQTPRSGPEPKIAPEDKPEKIKLKEAIEYTNTMFTDAGVEGGSNLPIYDNVLDLVRSGDLRRARATIRLHLLRANPALSWLDKTTGDVLVPTPTDTLADVQDYALYLAMTGASDEEILATFERARQYAIKQGQYKQPASITAEMPGAMKESLQKGFVPHTWR